jgi:hypothetical protein
MEADHGPLIAVIVFGLAGLIAIGVMIYFITK